MARMNTKRRDEASVDGLISGTAAALAHAVRDTDLLATDALRRPPFRLVFDIVRAVTQRTAFAAGLYDDAEVAGETLRTKAGRLWFLAKLIAFVESCLDVKVDVRPAAILAGSDPTGVHYLLRGVGDASKVGSDVCRQAVASVRASAADQKARRAAASAIQSRWRTHRERLRLADVDSVRCRNVNIPDALGRTVGGGSVSLAAAALSLTMRAVLGSGDGCADDSSHLGRRILLAAHRDADLSAQGYVPERDRVVVGGDLLVGAASLPARRAAHLESRDSVAVRAEFSLRLETTDSGLEAVRSSDSRYSDPIRRLQARTRPADAPLSRTRRQAAPPKSRRPSEPKRPLLRRSRSARLGPVKGQRPTFVLPAPSNAVRTAGAEPSFDAEWLSHFDDRFSALQQELRRQRVGRFR
mmetsp:Transcript_14527/g.50594  ORF Transcript_14527/g.50594 Transcript_14527/m.50594 type:complete len:412 (+) Transcript_14527:262-1497(+)